MRKAIWITWEKQRRSVELAKKIGLELFIIEYRGLLRYPVSILRTASILAQRNPDILFVQNPSMVLAAFSVVYTMISKTRLVVDRHSNFLLGPKTRSFLYIRIFKLFSAFTLRFADLTIVTNNYLAEEVRRSGGRPFVLPDKVPDLPSTHTLKLKGKFNILLISSFGYDEPIREAVGAMRCLEQENIYLYITGNYKRLNLQIRDIAPRNVLFTGYLEDEQFVNMLYSVDAIMALTKIDHCMLCGCYEAVAAGQPLITSDKKVLREYFNGALFVKNTSHDISVGIREVIRNKGAYKAKIKKLRHRLSDRWEWLFRDLEFHLRDL